MSRVASSRTAILEALEAGGVNAASSGKFSAPCVLVEAGDPWVEVQSLGRRRLVRWRLTAVAGRSDTDGIIQTLAELVDRVDDALLALPGVQLPSWGHPFGASLDGTSYAATVATIQTMTTEEVGTP